MAAKAKHRHNKTPTIDAYFNAAIALAAVVRKAYDTPGSVKRDELRKALERFERLDYHAL